MAENINISPDMINNLVNMLKNSNSNNSNQESAESSKESSSSNSNTGDSRGFFSNSSSSKLDMQTIMKIKSIMDALDKKDDPKSNLLYSLKPYLRKSKQAKLDQYVNLLKISQVTGLFNNKEGDSK